MKINNKMGCCKTMIISKSKISINKNKAIKKWKMIKNKVIKHKILQIKMRLKVTF